MEAKEHTVNKILTEQYCYVIPPYQRPYSWTTDNVIELLEDTWEAYESGDDEYFVGSLITIEKEKDRLYEVVDGQQRLTTLNILFARLRDKIEDTDAKAEIGKRILPSNVLTGETESPRLTIRNSDQTFFKRHILESKELAQEKWKGLPPPQQRIMENAAKVDGFLEAIDERSRKLCANFILTKVYVVLVKTDSFQSAYRLFNVLNARGLPLANADLIKNGLFSKLGDRTDGNVELDDQWQELEQTVGIESLDQFLSHFRTMCKANKARGSLHDELQPLIDQAESPFTFLEQLNNSATDYISITECALNEEASLRPLRSLHRVAFDEWIPPLLRYLSSPVEGLPEAEFVSLLERITMQNWVRRLGRTARLTVYHQLIKAIDSGSSASAVRDIFTANANNDEFFHLLNGEVYTKTFAKAVLLRLEESSQDDSVTKDYSGRITIEHVLPQALKDEYWTQRFSEEDHATWLHRLGNLALLSGNKNYKAQYYSFDRKKKIYTERGKKRVSFDITKDICDCEEWTLRQLEDRQTAILNLAVSIWEI